MSRDTEKIRQGEELNEANLREFLGERFSNAPGEIEILQFPSGSSNLTYLIKMDGQEFVLRRPPFGNTVVSAHDMKREFGVLSKLSAVYQPAPKPLIYCADETIIGSEFYLMERRKGLIIRGVSPETLENSKELQRKVCESFIENLVELHSLNYQNRTRRFGQTRRLRPKASRRLDETLLQCENRRTRRTGNGNRMAQPKHSRVRRRGFDSQRL